MKFFGDIKDNFLDKVDSAKRMLSVFNVFFFIYNVISFVVFIVTTTLTFKNSDNRFFQILSLVTLLIYFVVLAVLIGMNVFKRKKLGSHIKSYRKSMRVVKILLQIFNLVLSILVIISASGGNVLDTMWQVILIIFSSVGLFFNIAFFIIMHRWNKRRAQKKASKPQKPKYESAQPVLQQSNETPQKQKLPKFDFKSFAKGLIDNYFTNDSESKQNKDD